MKSNYSYKLNLKTSVLLFFLLAFMNTGFSQKPKENTVTSQKNLVSTEEIYKTIDLVRKPEYPGGMQDFYKFIGANYKVPKTPPDVFLKGKIHLTFIVEKDGSLTDLKIVNDIGYGTGEEAVRVVKLSKKWIPGKTVEGNVAVLYSLPITIQSAN